MVCEDTLGNRRGRGKTECKIIENGARRDRGAGGRHIQCILIQSLKEL
jgi:hypothetical protein